MTHRPLDRTDFRILGKLRACERRKSVFNPGLRLIAHDLRLPLSTVWRRLWKLAAYRLVAVWKAPRRGLRYIWRTSAFYRSTWNRESGFQPTNRYTPSYGGVPNPSEQPSCQPNYDVTRPEGLIALELHQLGARSQAPPGQRRRRLLAIARGLAGEGLTIEALRKLVGAAHRRCGLVMWWLAKGERWRDVILDVDGRAKREQLAKRKREAEEPVVMWVDGKPKRREGTDMSLASILGGLGVRV